MNSVVSRESLFPEAMHRPDHGIEIQGNLVFDDGVERGMCRDVGKFDPSDAMIGFDENNSLLFVEFEPYDSGSGVRSGLYASMMQVLY